MTTATVLYSEKSYPDDSVEQRIYGPGVRIIFPNAPTNGLADLSDEDKQVHNTECSLKYEGVHDMRASGSPFVHFLCSFSQVIRT